MSSEIIVVKDKPSDFGFYSSDSGSEAVKELSLNNSKFTSLPSEKKEHSLHASSKAALDCELSKENTERWVQCSPRVEPSNTSIDESVCISCGLRPADTCVVHHLHCHYCFCIDCATIHFRTSGLCPLCDQCIIYIYKYQDI